MWARVLVAATIAWPLVAGGALWHRVSEHQAPQVVASVTWATVVYVAASKICHQKSERSFHMQGVAWPVCARCAGLYVAAPFAALFALWRRPPVRGRAGKTTIGLPWLLAMAAIPTALTLMWEWGGMGMPAHLWRFVTALPLGAAVSFALVRTTLGDDQLN